MHIVVERLTKRFGPTLVLDGIDLTIQSREFLGLLGPSGSGKTTLLRILAGLEFAEEGRVLFDGRDAQTLPIEERQVGIVFQHYALFGHMKVADNVAFGLKVRPRARRPSRQDIAARVERLLDLVQLGGLGGRFPGQLSGGQRQRVALARALATEPKVLLLDEPFGALDAKVRVELRRWLRELHEQTGLTTVFVTHDQEEALALADRVAIMAKGRIEQAGTPTEVYEGPRTPFVYDFLGRTNAFDCLVENGHARIGDKAFPVEDGPPDGPAVAFVRPHDVVLTSADDAAPSPDARLPGLATVRLVTALGPKAWVELAHDRQVIAAEVARETVKALGLAPGVKCAVHLKLPCFFSKQANGT
ncbi:MAG TPA: sulfate ABC transporter ATP-binding protein [Beijerinckiaceae bacterium]|jgi:sulfate transport system ATP-binding protein